MGIRAVIVMKSFWEKWNLSDVLKDRLHWGICGILK